MNNFNNKSGSQKFPFENSNLYTQNNFNRRNQVLSNNENGNYAENEISGLYRAISKIINRLDDLEEENGKLRNDLNDTRTRENKLLNRFSWLIFIINVGTVILIIISVILFINSVYPFLKDAMENDTGLRVIVGIIGGTISTGICSIWLTFNKYVNKVIERERNTN